MSEAEARRKEKSEELARKKLQVVLEETSGTEPETTVYNFKVNYKAAARDNLNWVQQELATREIDQKVKLKLENDRTQDQLNAFEAPEVKKTKAPSNLSMKLIVISGQTFIMVPQSIMSILRHQVIRNLSEP